MKKILIKSIVQLLKIATIAGVAIYLFSLYKNDQDERKYEDLVGTKDKYEQLTVYVAKLESRYVEQEKLHEKSKKEWKEVAIAIAKDERIKLLSDATYLIGKHAESQNGPDYYYETPGKPKNYVSNELRIAGKDSPPVGYILIRQDGRTYKRTYEFEILVKNLQTVDETTGKIKVYTRAYLISKESGLAEKRRKDFKNWKDVPYSLPIVGGVAYIDPTEPISYNKSLIWWAPHVNGGFSVGVDSSDVFVRPTADFSIAGYGRSRNDLDFKLFHLGLNSDTELKRPGVHFIPFSYRPIEKILTNTYVGPGIGWTSTGVNYQLNLNLSF